MFLAERIEQDVITAMKAREQEKLDTLRMVRAALKNEQIALGHELNDAEVIKVLQRQIKQRKDAMEQYQAANRPEAAEKEQTEARIIETYLPQQMSDDELAAVVEAVIAETGAAGTADMGKVIGQVMHKVGAAAEGARVSAIVKNKLSS